VVHQDLHIHTTFSANDNAVVPEQTVALIASIKHAKTIGISDHFENLVNGDFDVYEKEVRQAGFKVGAEIDGHPWVNEAIGYQLDYYIFHCRNQAADYRSLDLLLMTGKPVIIAHPNALDTDLKRVSAECLIEINNRYVWRNDWRAYYNPHKESFRFILSSDAHQPNWLGQAAAHHAAEQLGIKEHLVFKVQQ
jgi:histidinol phosphatase-like PHP family hydrolase